MQAMTQAIQNDDPSLISALNNEGVKRKVERTNMMESSISKSVTEYEKLVEYYSSPDYEFAKKTKDEELKLLKSKGAVIPEDFWMANMPDGTEVNLMDETNELRKRMDNANDINESYRRENIQGFSYKESFDKDFPWDEELSDEDLILVEEILEGKKTVLDLPKEYYGKGEPPPKLDTKSFDDIVNYADKLDTKKDIYTSLLDEKVPNYYYLSNTIFKLKNLEKKYGKDSKQYKKTYNKAKKSFDVFQTSGLPYFRRKEQPTALQRLREKELLKSKSKKKAGAVR
jgi:hypothetical protein